MLKLIWSTCNKQSPKVKIASIFIIIAFIACLVLFTQKAYYKYQYFKQVEQNYNTAKDSISSLNNKIKDLTQKQQILTEKAQKQARSINDKLKQDENTIDNRNVTDDELLEFLSRYDQDN